MNELTTQDTFARNLDQKLAQAKMISNASLIPDRFRNKPADVLLAMDMAERLNMSATTVLQNIYFVYGKPSWTSSFILGCINGSGKYKSVGYKEEETSKTISELGGRKNLVCRVAAVTVDGQEVFGPPISFETAVKEGWVTKDNSKWKTMPDLMLRYRAVTFFARTMCPEILFGLHSKEENEDIYGTEEVEYRHQPKLANKPDFKKLIAEAKTNDDLKDVAEQVKASNVDETEKSALRFEFINRQQELRMG